MIVTLSNVLFSVALALIGGRALGHLFDRLKQPAVIGEILAGVLLGLIGMYVLCGQELSLFSIPITMPALVYDSQEFELFADLGILFLLFITGLETSLSQLKKMERASALVAIGGVVVPCLLGIVVGIVFGFSLVESVIIGLILVATSVGVTVRTLMDINVLDTNVGATILGAAVIDDVIGVLLLAFVLGTDPPLFVGLKVVLFFLIFLYLGLRIIDKILDLGEKVHLPKAFLSIALALFLLYSFFADQAGIAGIIGAFVAGLLIGQTIRSQKIVTDVRAIGYGFFIPIFFVWVGTNVNLTAFTIVGVFAVVVIIVSILGKIAGCGIGAKLAGMTSIESLQVGVGMIPRMELALVIATAAISHGMVETSVANQILATTILLTIVTTVITPLLVKTTFKT
ncbi:MAG: cation:proton antiporter [Candidatus Thermoplasmatota archaeon]|nr:cation:proton antiporter [Candidatus Thermoplasmatota archaeon]